MSAREELFDPVQFIRADTRIFVDTNVFMQTAPQYAGGLKSLFERCADAILQAGCPIVVPTKVQDELRVNQRKLRKRDEEKAAKAHNALIFLKSATDAGLVRTSLGDVSNPYADDLFLDLFERFAATYSFCLLTFDITPKLRVRLLAHKTGTRMVAGHPTKSGDVAVEHDDLLYWKGQDKLRKLVDRGGKQSEIEELRDVLPEFHRVFGIKAPLRLAESAETDARSTAIAASGGHLRTTPEAPVRRFAVHAAARPRDTPLVVSSIPSVGDKVTWESASTNGTIVLGGLLGQGGEGSVYARDRNTVVKVFDKNHITQHRKSKIELLVNSGLQGSGLCIPSATVRNTAGEFVGYVMPKASGREARTIFNIRKLEKDFPTWKKSDLVDICISFLKQVDYLHSMNVILGDINPKNLMIDDRKNVFIIDADSWQLEGYPCPVGTPMYTSPAMLGKTYAEDLRSMEDELFAVATMLFQIVMTGQFPYMRTGTDGDMVKLIREGNFAFQYENRNNKDQPDGDWKYIWSHIYKPVKDLFWHTFHKEGARYAKRPTAAEWLEAFNAYKAYLANSRLNFDPMSNDVRPIRYKAFKPDTPIQDCTSCGRKHAIAGVWNDDSQQYFVPRQCNKCREAQPSRHAVARAAATKAKPLDTNRLCVDCRQPFITFEHIDWFQSRTLNVPKSHSAIKQTCPPTGAPSRTSTTQSKAPAQAGLWARFKKWLHGN